MTPHETTADLTPDNHVRELEKLARHYEKAAAHFGKDGTAGKITRLYQRRALALRWLLSLNAYGVDASEVVT